jgi:EAL domain-containing protein (putative c-di-GMP-specific phosphodiesterase class I)
MRCPVRRVRSSLGLLQSCPVDILKVDKSFIDGIVAGTRQTVVASALIHIAEGMHLQAIAEGVETAAQAARLHDPGCRYAQGNHFARPMHPAALADLLAGTPVLDAGTTAGTTAGARWPRRREPG